MTKINSRIFSSSEIEKTAMKNMEIWSIPSKVFEKIFRPKVDFLRFEYFQENTQLFTRIWWIFYVKNTVLIFDFKKNGASWRLLELFHSSLISPDSSITKCEKSFGPGAQAITVNHKSNFCRTSQSSESWQNLRQISHF